LSYTGGKAGKADPALSPIAIGWVNAQGGPVAFPEATNAAQAAANYVNAELGGVGGHPLQIHTCFIAQAEEEGQKCGQQLVADKAVDAVAFGAVVTGNQSFASVINGQKPVMIGVSVAPSDAKHSNYFLLYGSSTSVLGPWGTYGRDVLHAKTVAEIYPNQAGSTDAAAAMKAGLEKAGLKVKSVGYDPQATDLLGPLTAAGAQTADMVVPVTDAPGCINTAKALHSIGRTKNIVPPPLCLAAPVQQALGDFPLWTYGIAQTLPTDTTAADSKAYVDTATRYGLSRADSEQVFAALAWGQILTYVKLMNAVGADKITPDALAQQLKNFKGPLIMGAPEVQCGKYPDQPAVCNDQTKFYDYQGKGTFKAVTGWLRPPK
jgi:branched-chain amino acid transport system substrate-binding protein